LISSASTSAELDKHLSYLEAEYAAAVAAPLSRKRVMLVALLIDAFADRMFAASGAEDVLVYREDLAARFPTLGPVFALAAQRSDGPQFVHDAVPVPLSDYHQLSIEDFMVSLYNDHTVQRVRIAMPDGSRRDAHEVLSEAIAAFRSQLSTSSSS
jgi:hypothetical protein